MNGWRRLKTSSICGYTINYRIVIITGGGQKLHTDRVVLPVADNIFK